LRVINLIKKYKPIDLNKVKTISIRKRKSKVKVKDFAKVTLKGEPFDKFLSSLPQILAGEDFRKIVGSIVRAYQKEKPVIAAMGAQVIKCGLSPIIIDLMEKRIITAIALNGAGVIHDVEIALFGETSEEVEEGLKSGMFGMARETSEFINLEIRRKTPGVRGYGEKMGKALTKSKARYIDYSILAKAYKLKIPVTVHLALGTDINHMHPSFEGGAGGRASLYDFRLFTSVVKDLGGGGVLLNIGSAVILPEVILKAINVAKNLGYDLRGSIGVNLDFIQHYRSSQQVVNRIKVVGGKGYSITCHHELIIPLLARAVVENVKIKDKT